MTREEKKRQLAARAASTLRGRGIEQSERAGALIVESFVAIDDDVVERLLGSTPPASLTNVSLRVAMPPGGRTGGESVKFGNLTLDLHKLLTAAAGAVLTIAGTTQAPWMTVLGGLVIWDSVYSSLRIKLDEGQASVLWALWKHKDRNNKVAIEDVPSAVAIQRERFGRQPLSEQQLHDALFDLERMKCIKKENGGWLLTEAVKCEYR